MSDGETQEVAARKPLTNEEWEAKIAAWNEDRKQRFNGIRNDARALYHAYDRWREVGSEEDWQQKCLEADQQYQSGRFLIEQLGGERYLYPEQMATLWNLRRRLLEEFDAQGPAEMMLIDAAVLGYYNLLRVQGWIGNAATTIEAESFGQESPTAKFKKKYGYSVEGLRVEDVFEALVQRLMPLLDRCNRMMIRNLRAVKELRAPAAPAVAINQAGQVNVGTQQVNAVQGGSADRD